MRNPASLTCSSAPSNNSYNPSLVKPSALLYSLRRYSEYNTSDATNAHSTPSLSAITTSRKMRVLVTGPVLWQKRTLHISQRYIQFLRTRCNLLHTRIFRLLKLGSSVKVGARAPHPSPTLSHNLSFYSLMMIVTDQGLLVNARQEAP